MTRGKIVPNSAPWIEPQEGLGEGYSSARRYIGISEDINPELEDVDPKLYDLHASLPDRQWDGELAFRWHQLWRSLWHVLAVENDELENEAASARRQAAECARLLREYCDPLDGPDGSDIRVAWAAEMARLWFNVFAGPTRDVADV